MLPYDTIMGFTLALPHTSTSKKTAVIFIESLFTYLPKIESCQNLKNVWQSFLTTDEFDQSKANYLAQWWMNIKEQRSVDIPACHFAEVCFIPTEH